MYLGADNSSIDSERTLAIHSYTELHEQYQCNNVTMMCCKFIVNIRQHLRYKNDQLNDTLYHIRVDNKAKNRKLNKLATTNSNFGEKSIISYMHHGITYMYINFQQNRVSKSVKTVRINLFAKSGKLPKFATTSSNFEKIDFLRHASS